MKNFTIQENISLASHTTIRLGGPARYFALCSTVDEVKEGIQFANKKKLPLYILGGGSNTIFLDEGFSGIVLKIQISGIEKNKDMFIVKAGEVWDNFVLYAVQNNFAGIECLSGIPGLIGATPIQNVGAYGQEISETFFSAKVLNTENLEEEIFFKKNCHFRYRHSFFKEKHNAHYIITEVTFQLQENGNPIIHYPELQKYLENNFSSLTLHNVRDAVLTLRRKKSMVMDGNDKNTFSVGSFFLNPIISITEFEKLVEQWKSDGFTEKIPTFPSEDKIKIPAAWLIEKSGFVRGYEKNGVGISSNHTLALVNKGGTTKALLELAYEIQEKVYKKFSLCLEREPIVVEK